MTLRRFVLFGLPGLLLLVAGTLLAADVREQSLAFAAPEFEVEDLVAELQNDGQVIYVSGKIRNRSQAPVRGYVVVYYRNGNNEPVHAVEVEVNQKKVFGHGEAGFFEATTPVAGISGIASVSVEFVDQPTPVKKPRSK